MVALEAVRNCFQNAFICGVQPNQFWKLTPYSFNLIAKAQAIKLDHEERRGRWELWHIAALQRAKRLPSLKKFMTPLNKSVETGINEAEIKSRLKAYQDGQSSKSKR